MKTTVNFRDLGGLRGYSGKKVVRQKLYRGGQLFGMTDQEKIEFCRFYGIKTIIDLRNEESYSAEPNGKIPRVKEYIFEVMKDMEELSGSNPMRNSSAEAASKYLEAVYGEFVTNAHARKCFLEILKIMTSHEEGGIYFHCFAGKDRTGVVAAIMLSVLGVSRADILADYMKTLAGRKEENQRLLALAKQEGKTDDEIGAMKVYYNVEQKYLEKVFEMAESGYGSFNKFIEDGIGLSGDLIVKMRSIYLER